MEHANHEGKRTSLASARLTAHIEKVIRQPIQVEHQLAGGWNNGALLVSVEDEALVLKIHGQRTHLELKAIRQACEVARDSGWPTPAWRFLDVADTGERWSLQELCAGTSLTELTEEAALAIIEANEAQAGLAGRMTGKENFFDRSAVVHDMLVDDRWGHLAKLAGLSGSACRLVDIIQDRVLPLPPLPADDLVHGDYSPENILMIDGTVSAFVDTDELGYGTRYSDLADLFNKTYESGKPTRAQQLLANAAIEGIGERGFVACLATNSIGVLAWIAERMPDRLPERIHSLTHLYNSDLLTPMDQ